MEKAENSDSKVFLQCANVGDSTAFMLLNGEVVILSEDHKATNIKERARLEAMGISLPVNSTRLAGLAISRAFGDFFPKEIACGIISAPHVSLKYEIPENTKVIVASDGLWDVITSEEAFELIKNMDNASEAAHKLVKTAMSKFGCYDNITVIVIHL